MKKDFQHIMDIFRKALSDTLTSDQEKEFETLLKEPFFNQIYKNMHDNQYIECRLSAYYSYSAERAYQKFKHQFGRKVTLRQKITRWSIAATILILVATGIITHTRTDDSLSTPMPEYTIIQPGVPRAQLKLADGRTIEVNSATEGKIEEKKGTVIQYESGNLTYIGSSPDSLITKIEYNELSVPLGGECHVTLEDGTSIWINAGSKLKYPVRFGTNVREIYIEGEAYFDVKKDPRTFTIHTTLGEVHVLGTSFGIKAYPDENMFTTLVSGEIAFSRENQAPVIIAPGEQIIASPSGEIVRKKVDVEEHVGWKNGLYVFKKQKLEDIMTNLERWYDVKVFYQSQQIKNIPFSGSIERYNTINTFLEVLEETGELKFTISGKTIVLYQ